MFTPAGNTNKKEIERIRRLVDARLHSLYGSLLGFAYEAVIAETLCTEPDCVPIETIIGIILIDKDTNMKTMIQPRRFTTKVLKPLIEVKQMDILGISFPFRVESAATPAPAAPEPTQQAVLPPAPPAIESSIDIERQACKRLLSALREGLASLTEIESWKRMKEELQREVNELDIRIKIRVSEEKATKVTIVPNSVKLPTSVESIGQSDSTAQNYPTNPNTASSMTTNSKSITEDDEIITIVKRNELSVGPVISAVNAYSKSLARTNASSSAADSASNSSRHDKNRPKSGCPCCDPDNLDHIVDKLLFMERPGI